MDRKKTTAPCMHSIVSVADLQQNNSDALHTFQCPRLMHPTFAQAPATSKEWSSAPTFCRIMASARGYPPRINAASSWRIAGSASFHSHRPMRGHPTFARAPGKEGTGSADFPARASHIRPSTRKEENAEYRSEISARCWHHHERTHQEQKMQLTAKPLLRRHRTGEFPSETTLRRSPLAPLFLHWNYVSHSFDTKERTSDWADKRRTKRKEGRNYAEYSKNFPNKAMPIWNVDDQRVPLRNTQIICSPLRWHLFEDFCCTPALKPNRNETNEAERNKWKKE